MKEKNDCGNLKWLMNFSINIKVNVDIQNLLWFFSVVLYVVYGINDVMSFLWIFIKSKIQ